MAKRKRVPASEVVYLSDKGFAVHVAPEPADKEYEKQRQRAYAAAEKEDFTLLTHLPLHRHSQITVDDLAALPKVVPYNGGDGTASEFELIGEDEDYNEAFQEALASFNVVAE